MEKVKKTDTPIFEMLYIISNKYSEEELKPIVEKVHQTIKDAGGNTTYTEEWGKKRLAYPIKHFHHGYYFLVEFQLEKEKVNDLNRSFKLTNELLRHMIVARKISATEEQAPAKKEGAKTPNKEVTNKTKEEDKKKKGKVDIEDLDKKLDKILDTEDLI